MNDPVKVIWKYKNNNRRIQYLTYIFIGIIPKDIEIILNKIADLKFYDTLIKLSKHEYKKLENYYGEKWYLKFFNTLHINYTISIIKDSIPQSKELIEKYGSDWVKKHIELFKLIEKKLIYSYESLIKDEFTRKLSKKKRLSAMEEEKMEDFRTTKQKLLKKEIKENNLEKTQFGGDEEEYDEEPLEEVTDYEQIESNESNQTEIDELESTEIIPEEEDEEDVKEIEQMIVEPDARIDENIEKTTNQIKKAIIDTEIYERTHNLITFDTTNDNNIYDDNLRNIYIKKYVKTQYIYKDDTIKNIKYKICCSMKNNDKFSTNSYILPSRQYLWSEYYFDGKIEKIMIGQKWMRSTELLNIDIEPNNNLRVYEELKDSLKSLRDNIKRHNNKIIREEDETNILCDYDDYLTNNEIFMIDLYNDLGLKYNPDPETTKNLIDVYLRFYFFKTKSEEFKSIIDYLNSNTKNESEKITSVYETINNDLVMENEIMNTIEHIKNTEKYKVVFKNNYITNVTIHVNLRMINNAKINLFRIFDNFVTNEQYPFLHYQTIDGSITYKYNEKEISKYLQKSGNLELLEKWFENAPYGLSIKMKSTYSTESDFDRFMVINISDNGKVEYKIQWKAIDLATINDVGKTYNSIKNLIKKINSEFKSEIIEIPEDSEFKYAFINSIQEFELPEKYVINHNDLSDFSRFFYPYISLVIEPRKRIAKVHKGSDKGKFGTYLRYKRVSKYENQARIEQRIIYFLRNYEVTEQLLTNEISKQFNITLEKAIDEYKRVKQKYPNLKKSRKILKKMENIPKYKPPGISIDIQGKQRENYKIRISGSRNEAELNRILTIVNIIIYLYSETYLIKNHEKQKLKEKLQKLVNIAERRNKVDVIVNYEKEIKDVKKMAKLDKLRIGFKTEKGQNQYTRLCQNSGTDKHRRPRQTISNSMTNLIKQGYKLNKKSGQYERKVKYKNKEFTLKTIRVNEYDDDGNPTGNDIHYSCDPEINGEHFYVGYLTKGSNPTGHCIPCCFKKNPELTVNKQKKNFIDKCNAREKEITKETFVTQRVTGDLLYILQDTNKIQDGRIGFLPKYLDIYFNHLLSNKYKIKHHYLVKTEPYYFFKLGVKQDEFPFFNAVSILFDTTITDIKKRITSFLEHDRSEHLFTSLNNGDIRTQFGSVDGYVKFINNNKVLDFDETNNVLSIPNILHKNGVNFIIFNKKIITIHKVLEKVKFREDFLLKCQDSENVDNLISSNKICVFMIQEDTNYYPIIAVKKTDELSKTFDVIKQFHFEKNNIVDYINDFYEKNFSTSNIDEITHKKDALPAKSVRKLLFKFNDKKYNIKYQITDVRNKCKYLITNDSLIIPTKASGCLYDIQIIKSLDKYVDTFDSTLIKLDTIYKMSNKNIPIKPIGVYYDEKNDDSINVIAIMTKTYDGIPVIKTTISIKDLEHKKLIYENKPITDIIDKQINLGKDNYKIDDRIISVNKENYENESYELFRMELSEYINSIENSSIKNRLEKFMTNDNLSKTEKRDEIKLLLFRLIDKNLFETTKKITSKNLDEFNESDFESSESKSESSESKSESSESKSESSESKSESSESKSESSESKSESSESKSESSESKVDNDKLDDDKLDDDKLDDDKLDDDKLDDDKLDDDKLDDDKLDGGKYDRFIHITNKKSDLTKYKIINQRTLCKLNNKNTCSTNPNCQLIRSECLFTLTKEMVIKFVNKVSEDLSNNNIRALEIMRTDKYYVSDIADQSKFTERTGQKIIKSNNTNIKRILNEMFGKDYVPKIGRRKISKNLEINYQQLNITFPLIRLKDYFVQPIINKNLTVFRAYSNGFYWIKNQYSDVEVKNLGYYSPLQSELSSYFRGQIIDWLQDVKNEKIIKELLFNYLDVQRKVKNHVNGFIIRIVKNISEMTNCVVELFILSKINKIPVVVYDTDNVIRYVFDESKIITDKNKETYSKVGDRGKYINLRFSFVSNNRIPDSIDVLYFN
jgi:hypothetical protein